MRDNVMEDLNPIRTLWLCFFILFRGLSRKNIVIILGLALETRKFPFLNIVFIWFLKDMN